MRSARSRTASTVAWLGGTHSVYEGPGLRRARVPREGPSGYRGLGGTGVSCPVGLQAREAGPASVRRDVLVQPEEVRRIIGALEGLQPLVFPGAVGLPDP